MPIDPSIVLQIRPPAPGPSILDTYQQITQIQEQKRAGEERRAAGLEAKAKREREAQIEQAMQSAIRIDPTTGQPTIDYATLLPHVPASAIFEVKKQVDAAGEQALRLRETNISVEQKIASYLGGVSRAVRAAGYDPKAYGLAVVGARRVGALTQAQADQLLDEAEADPTTIQRHVDAAIAQAGGEKAETGFTLSPGQTRYGAGGEVVATVPANAPSGLAAGFTLSPGQTRYGAAGEVLAAVPDRPPTATGGGRAADREALITAVIDNPGLWDQITPTERGRIAGELRRRGFIGFGKPLSDAAVGKISESKSAIGSLQDLREVLKKNEQYLGPIAGLAALNPYSAAAQAQADVDRVRQRVGKALEGGVLRKEDEEKYKRILATLRDVPETAIYKVDQLIEDLQRDMQTYTNEQRLAGRRVPQSPTPAATPYKVGDIVTVRGQKVRVTKLLPNGKYEAVQVP